MIRDCVLGNDEPTWRRYSDYAGSIHASGAHLLLLIPTCWIFPRSNPAPIACMSNASISRPDARLPDADRAPGPLRQCDRPAHADGRRHGGRGRYPRHQTSDHQSSVQCREVHAPGGQVEVCIQEIDGAIDLRVRDTGIGVASEHLDSVFEPFHQGDAALARRFEGTGWPVCCRGLLAMHGGGIGLESKPGKAPPPSSSCPKAPRRWPNPPPERRSPERPSAGLLRLYRAQARDSPPRTISDSRPSS